MRNPLVALVLAGVCAMCLLRAPDATAGPMEPEIWLGAGASWPDYGESAMACVRGGAGLVFARHVTLGVSAQADRDRVHYFADTSLILPPLGLLEPFGRFQIGRRDDRDDTAMAGSAGVRLGEETVGVFLEAFWIFEPQDDYGLSFGLSLR